VKGLAHVFKKNYIYTITQDLYYVIAITGFNRVNSLSKADELDEDDNLSDPRS
jgi:hypothetical protein